MTDDFFVYRIFAVAFSLAFKMISEIDMKSLNQVLSQFLDIASVKDFNKMESEILAAHKYDVGVSEAEF